jgi:hypothetical protein
LPSAVALLLKPQFSFHGDVAPVPKPQLPFLLSLEEFQKAQLRFLLALNRFCQASLCWPPDVARFPKPELRLPRMFAGCRSVSCASFCTFEVPEVSVALSSASGYPQALAPKSQPIIDNFDKYIDIVNNIVDIVDIMP